MSVPSATPSAIAVKLVHRSSATQPVIRDSASLAEGEPEVSTSSTTEEVQYRLSDALSNTEASVDTVPEEANSAAPVIHVPEPRYFLRDELTLRPAALNDPLEALTFDGVPSQIVILRLFIDEKGNVEDVVMEQSFLPESQADRLVNAFYRVRFTPGEIDALRVKSQIRVEVRLEESPI